MMLSNILPSRLLIAMPLYIFESDILALAPFGMIYDMIFNHVVFITHCTKDHTIYPRSFSTSYDVITVLYIDHSGSNPDVDSSRPAAL